MGLRKAALRGRASSIPGRMSLLTFLINCYLWQCFEQILIKYCECHCLITFRSFSAVYCPSKCAFCNIFFWDLQHNLTEMLTFCRMWQILQIVQPVAEISQQSLIFHWILQNFGVWSCEFQAVQKCAMYCYLLAKIGFDFLWYFSGNQYVAWAYRSDWTGVSRATDLSSLDFMRWPPLCEDWTQAYPSTKLHLSNPLCGCRKNGHRKCRAECLAFFSRNFEPSTRLSAGAPGWLEAIVFFRLCQNNSKHLFFYFYIEFTVCSISSIWSSSWRRCSFFLNHAYVFG